jgi:hypothetical protein
MLSRRNFLASLAAAVSAFDPERALWVPGKKLISIPPPRAEVSGIAILNIQRQDIRFHRDAYSFVWPPLGVAPLNWMPPTGPNSRLNHTRRSRPEAFAVAPPARQT